MQNPYLKEIIAQLDHNTQEVHHAFDSLSPDQLNWKPDPITWSIAECLAHLITTNKTYIPVLEAIADGTKRQSFWERLPWMPGIFGRQLRKDLGAEVKRKFVSPKAFQPSASLVQGNIIEDFATHQEEIKAKILATDNVAHRKMIIGSPAAAYITYSLYDACHIISSHELRHIRQAKTVKARQQK